MKVKDLFTPNVITVSPDESVSLAGRMLARHNVGSLPVCSEDGVVRGIVTDRDIVLRCIATEDDPQQTPVKQIMSKHICYVTPEQDIKEAMQVMAEEQVRRLPVLEDGKLTAMLSLADLARSHACDMEASKALSEISENIRRL